MSYSDKTLRHQNHPQSCKASNTADSKHLTGRSGLEIWPPGGTTCIAILTGIALLALSASIQLVSARVTSVKSQKPLLDMDIHGLDSMYIVHMGPIKSATVSGRGGG